MVPYYFSLFLKDDGHVYVSGINSLGQLGLGHKNNVTKITMIPDLENIKQVFTGYQYSFFINKNKDVYFCGDRNIANYMGKGSNDITVPTLIPELKNTVEIKSFANYFIFKDENNNYFRFDKDHKIVKLYDDFNNIKDIQFAGGATIILNNNGDVYSIGDDVDGYLGLGKNKKQVTEYTKINELSNIEKIVGANAITYDGKVYSWGSGYGLPQLRNFSPIERVGLPAIEDIILGNNHIIFLSKEGDVYGMSDSNNYGYLGYGDDKPVLTVKKNTNLSNIKSVIGAMFSTVFIDTNNDVYIAGYTDNKNYGDSLNGTVFIPTKIPELSNIISVNDSKIIQNILSYTILHNNEEFFYDDYNLKQTVNTNTDLNGVKQNAYRNLNSVLETVNSNNIEKYKVKKYKFLDT